MSPGKPDLPSRPDDAPQAASDWILAALRSLPPEREVLDIACGAGRHCRAALALGHRVCGIDIRSDGIADLMNHPGFTFFATDLENGPGMPLRPQSADAIIVTNYLHRPLFPAIAAAARPGGLIAYETFASGQERYGRPSNPDFLLRKNELLEWALGAGLIVERYEAATISGPAPRVIQRIIAIRPGNIR